MLPNNNATAMTTFKEFLLTEAPLPDDWEKDIFNPAIPYAQRVRYAKERAKQIGVGSSRIAFQIPYEGRPTILKVAKNKKGMAQNEVEARLLDDYYLEQLNLVIPMIDYDERSSQPTWIHMEKAEKINQAQFKKATGGANLNQLMAYAIETSGRDVEYTRGKYSPLVNDELEFVQNFIDFVGNYTHIPVGDLIRKANWGMYKGQPVIIDLGLDDTVSKTYYN